MIYTTLYSCTHPVPWRLHDNFCWCMLLRWFKGKCTPKIVENWFSWWQCLPYSEHETPTADQRWCTVQQNLAGVWRRLQWSELQNQPLYHLLYSCQNMVVVSLVSLHWCKPTTSLSYASKTQRQRRNKTSTILEIEFLCGLTLGWCSWLRHSAKTSVHERCL